MSLNKLIFYREETEGLETVPREKAKRTAHIREGLGAALQLKRKASARR
jgi:hypothetical protein